MPWAISALSTKPQVAGKRIGLLDGTYVSTNNNYESAGIDVQSGSAGSPTIVEAVNPRQAIITGRSGSSYPGFQGLIGVINGSYVTFRNLTVTDGVCKGVVVFGSNNIRIEGCHVFDFALSKNPSYASQYPGDNVEGIRIENSTDCVVSHCKIHGCYNAGGKDNRQRLRHKVIWQQPDDLRVPRDLRLRLRRLRQERKRQHDGQVLLYPRLRYVNRRIAVRIRHADVRRHVHDSRQPAGWQWSHEHGERLLNRSQPGRV